MLCCTRMIHITVMELGTPCNIAALILVYRWMWDEHEWGSNGRWCSVVALSSRVSAAIVSLSVSIAQMCLTVGRPCSMKEMEWGRTIGACGGSNGTWYEWPTELATSTDRHTYVPYTQNLTLTALVRGSLTLLWEHLLKINIYSATGWAFPLLDTRILLVSIIVGRVDGWLDWQAVTVGVASLLRLFHMHS